MRNRKSELQIDDLPSSSGAAAAAPPVSFDELSRLPEILHRSASREWYDYDQSPSGTGGGFLADLY